MSDGDFAGAKIVLFEGERLVVVLRDDLPTIPFPGQWDLPGGGREGAEAPEMCALREVEEELGLRVVPGRILHARAYPHHDGSGRIGWFFAAPVTTAEIAAIRLGEEGQGWAVMPIAEFVGRTDAVSHLQARVAEWWESLRPPLPIPPRPRGGGASEARDCPGPDPGEGSVEGVKDGGGPRHPPFVATDPSVSALRCHLPVAGEEP